MVKKGQKTRAKRILLVEAHQCTRCGQVFTILVREDNFGLTKRLEKILNAKGIDVVNLGAKIKCAKCNNEIVIK